MTPRTGHDLVVRVCCPQTMASVLSLSVTYFLTDHPLFVIVRYFKYLSSRSWSEIFFTMKR